MAGSIRGSDIAEPAPVIARAATAVPVRERRWAVLRHAARTRLAPLGVVVLLAALVVAVLAPIVSPHDPLKQDLGNVLAKPGRAHLLGTDNVGRDVLSRVIWGTRVSLVAGLGSVAIAVVAGGPPRPPPRHAGGPARGGGVRLVDAVVSFSP